MFVVIASVLVSFMVSITMMKFQQKMIERWMNDFFEKEEEFVKNVILHKHQ